MNEQRLHLPAAAVLRGAVLLLAAHAAAASASELAPAPTPADKVWLLPQPPQPADNPATSARIMLGKTLFFDPRLSGDGTVSCATCHNPGLAWSDGLKKGVGISGHRLGRATPTLINTAYNTQFMWDGRKKSLEDQALGPMKTAEEMNTDFTAAISMLAAIPGYRALFAAAYPGEPISDEAVAKAIASFERTIVSSDSRFDRWVAGDRAAITLQEWRGYQVFRDAAKGNCVVCHAPPNMTDNGFHNIGIAAAEGAPDEGRFRIRPVASMRGAFKTPTLRDIALTAPYFHDGSATTLMDVVEHYARGGDDHSNLSAEIRPLPLTATDKEDLVAFMKALTGTPTAVSLPILPQ